MNGKTLIPVGSTVQGTVAGLRSRAASRAVRDCAVPPHRNLANGERFNLSATVVDTNLHNGSDVNDEGQFKGNTRERGDNVELAAGQLAAV